MFEPKIFYKCFLEDYHKFKIETITHILGDLPKYENEFFGGELDEEEREAYKMTLLSELRQTYFHSIETFFEIFFALNPGKSLDFDDDNILFKLASSGLTTYKKVEEIANNPHRLDYLNEEISFKGYKLTVGHYIFYFGIFRNGKFKEEVFENIQESIEALKYGITLIAKDFIKIKREEYNSYKHGLRIIPALKEFNILNKETRETLQNWDLSCSMSYFETSKKSNALKVVTKLFDPKKDSCMANFCSDMISQMIFYRRLAKYRESVKLEQIPILFFSKEKIHDCNSANVQIQDLVWSLKTEQENSKIVK
ncbi:MAG: hypothetical protein ACTHJ5_14095 [Ilyomonas sp.]